MGALPKIPEQGLKIWVIIPEQISEKEYDFPEQVKFIVKALLVVKKVTIIRDFSRTGMSVNPPYLPLPPPPPRELPVLFNPVTPLSG